MEHGGHTWVGNLRKYLNTLQLEQEEVARHRHLRWLYYTLLYLVYYLQWSYMVVSWHFIGHLTIMSHLSHGRWWILHIYVLIYLFIYLFLIKCLPCFFWPISLDPISHFWYLGRSATQLHTKTGCIGRSNSTCHAMLFGVEKYLKKLWVLAEVENKAATNLDATHFNTKMVSKILCNSQWL